MINKILTGLDMSLNAEEMTTSQLLNAVYFAPLSTVPFVLFLGRLSPPLVANGYLIKWVSH